MKELSTEFRVRLQQEITRREESEELIAKQVLLHNRIHRNLVKACGVKVPNTL